MCFIVLIQNSKGGGLASGFSSSNAIMGVRKTTDFLEKATWGLAISMVIMSIATAYVVPHSFAVKDAVLEQAQKEQQTNPYNLPAGTAAPQTDATAPAESCLLYTSYAERCQRFFENGNVCCSGLCICFA